MYSRSVRHSHIRLNRKGSHIKSIHSNYSNRQLFGLKYNLSSSGQYDPLNISIHVAPTDRLSSNNRISSNDRIAYNYRCVYDSELLCNCKFSCKKENFANRYPTIINLKDTYGPPLPTILFSADKQLSDYNPVQVHENIKYLIINFFNGFPPSFYLLLSALILMGIGTIIEKIEDMIRYIKYK